LPDPALRHRVLAVPRRLRSFLPRDADLQGAVLRLFLRVVEQCLQAQVRRRPLAGEGAPRTPSSGGGR